MENQFFKKIHIIGSVGSGKTTLARKLSTNLSIPYYELDNVVRKRSSSGDVRRSECERDAYLRSIVSAEQWIVEGVHFEWVSQSFQMADLIIFLDTPYYKRIYRIIRRFILQKMKIEKANYKPTFEIFKKMFVWNKAFEDMHRHEIENLLSFYQEKVVIIKDFSDLEKMRKW